MVVGRAASSRAQRALSSKDFVQYLDQRALAHSQTETGAAPWDREQISVAGIGDAGRSAANARERPGSPIPAINVA